jgi:hypothetical protein
LLGYVSNRSHNLFYLCSNVSQLDWQQRKRLNANGLTYTVLGQGLSGPLTSPACVTQTDSTGALVSQGCFYYSWIEVQINGSSDTETLGTAISSTECGPNYPFNGDLSTPQCGSIQPQPNAYVLILPPFDPPQNPGGCDNSASNQGCAQTPEPINPANGNEILPEPGDYRSGDGRLEWKRVYNSSNSVPSVFSPGWQNNFTGGQVNFVNTTSTFDGAAVSSAYPTPQAACTIGWAQASAGLSAYSGVQAAWQNNQCQLSNGVGLTVMSVVSSQFNPASGVQVQVTRPSGAQYIFNCSASSCTASTGALQLIPTASGYNVIDENDAVENYSNGLLQSITYRGGYQQVLSYAGNQLSGITDSFGRSLCLF